MKYITGLLLLIMCGLGVLGLMSVSAGGSPQDDGICPDFNGDKTVMVSDILYVASQYHTADADADLNSNGIVQVDDILTVVKSYHELCTAPTPAATPYDFSSAGGIVPPGYASHQQFVEDWLDDHQLNHSNSGGGGSGVQSGAQWINAGCFVSNEPDCVIPESSTIIIHADGSVSVIGP